jgi:hypothetical protein
MRILLYNPDNGVTRNFMPHLWMFLLQALTPPGHEVILIDGNAQPMDEAGIARFVRQETIGLVGIGAMTRMIAKAYRMADAIRATGVPVVMGGPHVTEEADEALGRSGRAAMRVAVTFQNDERNRQDSTFARNFYSRQRFSKPPTQIPTPVKPIENPQYGNSAIQQRAHRSSVRCQAFACGSKG